MNMEKWEIIEKILFEHDIKPIIALVPKNKDKNLIIQKKNCNFYKKIEEWKKRGWEIALHGYDHVYITKKGGINPVNLRSEFAGVDLEKQIEKIKLGKKQMNLLQIEPKIFVAPSHTFDENTLVALKRNSIFCISDGKFFYPFKYKDMIFIPQQVGNFRKIIIPGIWTFCYHPNEMTKSEIEKFRKFIKNNKKYFISVNEINLENLKVRKKFSSILSNIYFFYKKYIKFKK